MPPERACGVASTTPPAGGSSTAATRQRTTHGMCGVRKAAAAFARWQELNNVISSIEHSLDYLDRLRARGAGKEQA